MILAGFTLNGYYYYFTHNNVMGILSELSILIAIAFILFEGILYPQKNKKHRNMWRLVFIFSITVTFTGQHFQMDEILNKSISTIEEDKTGADLYLEYQNQLDTAKLDKQYQIDRRSGIKKGDRGWIYNTDQCNSEIARIDGVISDLMNNLENKSVSKSNTSANESSKSMYEFLSFGSGIAETIIRIVFELMAALIMAFIAPIGIELLLNDVTIKRKLSYNDKLNIVKMLYYYKQHDNGIMMSPDMASDGFKRLNKPELDYSTSDIKIVYDLIKKKDLDNKNISEVMEAIGGNSRKCSR